MGVRGTTTLALTIVGLAMPGAAGPPARAEGPDAPASREVREARALADRVDRLLEAKWAEAGITPAPPADDAEYLRRVYLDIAGKIPTAAEARDFLDDPSPEKRVELVERLLASPAYMVRVTEIWRSMLLPEADTDPQARSLAGNFEAWLRKQVDRGTSYDELVREVLTTPLAGRGRRAGNPYDSRSEPTPLAFYAAKEGKPENLAAGVARAFLGVRLECAQCHNHPFASWKREDFWGLAAFFAGVSQQGPEDAMGPIREVAGRRELAIPGTDRVVPARFLDGASPPWGPRDEARRVLAEWVTSDDNPYFARAAVNRVWARFFGSGIVDPVDDMGEENPPVHPELLDALAVAFREHGYDMKYLVRALTMTRAYGLTGAVGQGDPSGPQLFSAMPVRGLSPGQLFDSLARATGFREGAPGPYGMDNGPARAQFLETFAISEERATESQTTILQALALMNGRVVAAATDPGLGDTLAAILEAPFLDDRARVEELYLAALARRPRPDEQALMLGYVEAGGSTGDRAEALADVFWALLNSPEFRHNR